MNGFLEALNNEEPGYSVTICCPGYTKSEFDSKKVVGDGSIVDLKLVTDESKYMTSEKAAGLIIKAIEKKKVLYHLTSQGGMGSTINKMFPNMINKAVKKEMNKIEGDTELNNEINDSIKESKVLNEEKKKEVDVEKKRT